MLEEYGTFEKFEMVYLYYIGLPYEYDRTNPRRIKMIFKGDPAFIKAKLADFWDGKARVNAVGLMNAFKDVTKSLWVDGTYKPNFYQAPPRLPETAIIGQIKQNEAENTGEGNQ